MTEIDPENLFASFAEPLRTMTLSHVWNGYGSALFLEFGTLSPSTKRDGSPANPRGEISTMIEFDWRIEGRRSIICGSCSEKRDWDRGFGVIQGQKLESFTLYGRIPELHFTFANGVHLLSFSTIQTQPRWVLFDRRGDELRTLHVRNGRLELE